MQSFDAVARVRVWARPVPLAPRALSSLVVDTVLLGASLEFGGAYRCTAGSGGRHGASSSSVQ